MIFSIFIGFIAVIGAFFVHYFMLKIGLRLDDAVFAAVFVLGFCTSVILRKMDKVIEKLSDTSGNSSDKH